MSARRRSRPSATGWAVSLIVVMGLLTPTSAHAYDAALSLAPSIGPPTTLTVAAGSGFVPGEEVVLRFDQHTLDKARADADGAFSKEVGVPAAALPGEHTVTAQGWSGSVATATFTVRTDWPTARFVPEGTGFNPYENVLSPSNVGDLELAWSALTDATLSTTPIVVDGVVYVAGHITFTGASRISAFDAATGELVWKRTGGGSPPSDLAMADGKLYVSFLDGHILRAYDAATGEQLWASPGPSFAPTVVDGVVYAADGLRSLWAIDAETGRKRWVVHVPLGGYGFGLAVADGMVYVGGAEVDGTSLIYGYDATTGDLVWRRKTGGSVRGTPAVVDGTVYVGSGDGQLYALDAETGMIRWRAPTGSGISASPAVADGAVFVGSTDDNVYSFDTETGEQLWLAPTGDAITASNTTTVANGVVYTGSRDDNEYVFDAVTGELLWSFVAAPAVYKQSVVDGTLYVTSFDKHLYAFRLPDGIAH